MVEIVWKKNIGVKYIEEQKIKLLYLTFLPNFHQLNLEQSTTPKNYSKLRSVINWDRFL